MIMVLTTGSQEPTGQDMVLYTLKEVTSCIYERLKITSFTMDLAENNIINFISPRSGKIIARGILCYMPEVDPVTKVKVGQETMPFIGNLVFM